MAAVAFLDHASTCFGAPTEVSIDQRREFLGSFEDLCTKILIDHYTTSQNHTNADGMAQQIVQMIKYGFCKIHYFEATIMIGTLCSHG